MQKFILLYDNGEFLVIFHAAPNKLGDFQWYLMNEPKECSETNISKEVYESIVLTSEDIEKYYQGKQLACHCKIDDEKHAYNEGPVYLTSNYIEMIKINQFDSISFLNEHGNICCDVGYASKNLTTQTYNKIKALLDTFAYRNKLIYCKCGAVPSLIEFWAKGTPNRRHYRYVCKACGNKPDEQSYRNPQKAVKGWNEAIQKQLLQNILKKQAEEDGSWIKTIKELLEQSSANK